MSELKPCPFCGFGQIESDAESGMSATDDSWSVTCEGCGATINQATQAEAEELWNQRAE